MSALQAEAQPASRRVEHVMGMPILVDVRDDNVDETVIDDVFTWLRWVDQMFSTYIEDSEINRIDRGELRLEDAHSVVRDVLERCNELRLETRGYFDVRAGGRLDPSGLVKGWSVDRAADILRAAGLRNFAVNAGGDIRLSGRAVPSPHWTVGIQHPRDRARIAAIVRATDLAVATSGAYARGDHVLNPYTRRPPSGVLSVTVVGPQLATADAFATAAFAMGGEAGAHWSARLRGYEAMTILADDTVLSTGGFPSE
jgi:thiamine biosynthesis lipoprotein